VDRGEAGLIGDDLRPHWLKGENLKSLTKRLLSEKWERDPPKALPCPETLRYVKGEIARGARERYRVYDRKKKRMNRGILS